MLDLSILIPARNEIFLNRTIQDLLEHCETDFEIIAVLDGQWPIDPIPQNPRVTVLYFPESVGQRAATNAAARIAQGKYLIKCDAHCAFDQGFDKKLLADMQPDWTMIPIMRNLHVFDWVCKKCGDRRYQGITPTSCPKCDNTNDFERDIVWIAKTNPQSASFCFDSEPHFQYFGDYTNRPGGRDDLTETMSIQGSFFLVSRDKYFELNLCDEQFGGWGTQGAEVATKTWLSGGRVIASRKTWYAHMFRTKGGDFGHPYELSADQVEHAKQKFRELFFDGKWEKQIRPLSWLVEKFWPVKGWKQEDLNKMSGIINSKTFGVLYYTDNKLDSVIMEKCQRQIKKSIGDFPLVSVSLKSHIDFGKNLVVDMDRGEKAYFSQILVGLNALRTDYVFMAEHDVLYHPSHFKFSPSRDDVFYYNTNVWKMRYSDGHGLYVDDCKQASGLCANRLLLIDYYEKVLQIIQERGYSFREISFEPGTRDGHAQSWKSEFPNIDIRHDGNFTKSRWKKEEFKDQKYTSGWLEKDNIPGWGHKWHFWKRV